MKSVIAFIIFAAIVVILGYGLQLYQAEPPAEPAEDPAYVWEFAEAGTDERSQAPLTRVTLAAGGVSYDAGLYTGMCFEMERSPLALLPDELSAAVCWFAGSGTEIGVFEENGRILVRAGVVDEGSAETPPYRGDFAPLFEVGAEPRLARLELRLGQEGSVLGLSVTPLTLEEDSRCPLDAQCIQAGTVRASTRLLSGLGESTITFTLGVPATTETEEITLVRVRPEPFSDATIEKESYVFEFSISKR